ncbi:MAG: YceI family protein [Bacteroidota bacterium]
MTWKRKAIRLICLAVLVFVYNGLYAQNYVSKSLRLSIFSSTPLEDIKAVSDQGTGVIVAKTREVVVQLSVKTLEFDRKLMQEHFNENFIESDKYPVAKFKGVLDAAVDLGRDGDYTTNVTGVLSVHGVDKQRTIPCKITVKAGVINVDSQFKVACADHRIEIPKLVFAKVAEYITVRISGQFTQQ